MASIIPGYEYDIFISYRQKDNKGDKWVSKFVDALKTELEATFKEDVSVYFDENPHDRLQETHNVDKSLEGKLKCLIFIPILSQIYCDPKSYAWQYEFLAFLKFAGEDHFGKDVRLRSGNVASRILPIRIHELESEDVKLFEKEIGSVLRALDFVYKTTSGVNRPLLPEDNKNDNLNKTLYRDQVNKVAGAIKEIVHGMRAEPVQFEIKEEQLKKSGTEVREEYQKVIGGLPTKAVNVKFISAFIVVVLFIIAGVITYPKIFKRDPLERLRVTGQKISVAVMPFQNMTNDTTWKIWQYGIQENIINYLSNYPGELDVRQSESVNMQIHKNVISNNINMTPDEGISISKVLDVNLFILGSIQKAGDIIRLNAKIINSQTGVIVKSFEVEESKREDKILEIIDSLRKDITNFLIISKLEKEISGDFRSLASAKSPEAYRYFIYGNNSFYDGDFISAKAWFLKSLERDSSLIFAAYMLAATYFNISLIDQAKEWCIWCYQRRESQPLIQKLLISSLYASLFETPYEDIIYCKQLLEVDNQQPLFHYFLGTDYKDTYQYNKAIFEFEEGLAIFKKWKTKPTLNSYYTLLGMSYHMVGDYKKEKQIYKTAQQYFPDDMVRVYQQSVLSLTLGDTIEAYKYFHTYLEGNKSKADSLSLLAILYSKAKILNIAEKYFRQAISLDPESPEKIHDLASFLISTDRNINFGLELVDKALSLSYDDFEYLNTKGWGLYKQGKYTEAYEILQKSWDLRMKNAIYNHEAFLHLEEAKKAVASQKNN